MYSASFVRKKMLSALEESILPAVSNRVVSHLLAEPPYDFSGITHRVLDAQPLPDIRQDPRQITYQWPQQKMLCAQHPFLIFVFDGVRRTRLGLTRELAKCQPRESRAGIYELQLTAPFSFYFPPLVPRESGFTPNPLIPNEKKQPVSFLQMHLFPDETLAAMHVSNENESFETHPLQIRDTLLMQSGLLYADELRQGERKVLAQSILSVMMHRLWRNLKVQRTSLANSSWPPNNSLLPVKKSSSPHPNELCGRVMEHIQTHLDQELSREILAARFKISAVQLNRLFLQADGITLMRYVTLQRINAAKTMLSIGNESIGDIAHFVGFSNSSSFSTVFRRVTGKSPRAFRQMQSGK